MATKKILWTGFSKLVRGFGTAAFLGIVMLTVASAAQAAPDMLVYEGAFPRSTANGFTRATLTINGTARDVLVYRPGSAASLPLLIYFSGTGATLDYNIADELGRDGLRAFADQESVVIAVPIPRVMDRGDWDNHSSGTPYWETAQTESVAGPASANPDTNPDLLLTRAIIKEAANSYGIDTSRVYLNGFSNGAFFSYFAATALNDRIAAFAETGGGLVLSKTTAGQPPCLTQPYAGSAGEARSCADAGWNASMCRAADAIARPISPALVKRVPPAYLEANDNDDSVPFAHSCNLSASIPATTPKVTRIMHTGNGHSTNSGYLIDSWNFMKRYRLQYQGLWWNPDESGWGMSLTQHNSTIFAALYTYDLAGLPTWYVMSNCPLTANGCSGEIYRATGGMSPAMPWDGSGKLVSKVGDGTLIFSDGNNGRFDFTINNVAGSKPIAQQFFAATSATTVDYTDLWWNPDESGWGIALTQQTNTIFAAWYAYRGDGQPIWYVASNCVVSNNGCSGDLYEVTGGSALTAIWDGSHKLVAKAGEVSFTFSDYDHGSMSYTVNGVAAVRSIMRNGF